jgi:hypothetical protein
VRTSWVLRGENVVLINRNSTVVISGL